MSSDWLLLEFGNYVEDDIDIFINGFIYFCIAISPNPETPALLSINL